MSQTPNGQAGNADDHVVEKDINISKKPGHNEPRFTCLAPAIADVNSETKDVLVLKKIAKIIAVCDDHALNIMIRPAVGAVKETMLSSRAVKTAIFL